MIYLRLVVNGLMEKMNAEFEMSFIKNLFLHISY